MHEVPPPDITDARPVVIFGGSGFLGHGLARWLIDRGRRVVLISRSQPSLKEAKWLEWDGRTLGPWAAALEGAAAVVNVVGRSVNCRKTPDHRDEILRSRLDSVRTIGEALAHCGTPPPVWVQAASTHIYGDPPEACCDETAAAGLGLAPDVCTRWEAAFEAARPSAMRGVTLRMSFVLGRDGGALQTLTRLTRWGLGGRVGSGKQWFSWVHQDDVNRAFYRTITDPRMQGIYNVTAPYPERNAEFMKTLRRVLHRPWSPPVPTPLVHLGSRLMDTDPELALYGRRCIPARLTADGFRFAYPNLDSALQHLLKDKRHATYTSDHVPT